MEDKDTHAGIFRVREDLDGLQTQPEGRSEAGHTHCRGDLLRSPAHRMGDFREAAGLHAHRKKAAGGLRHAGK